MTQTFLTTTAAHLEASAVLIFVVSTLLLTLGVGMKVWLRAVRLTSLEDMSLQSIEKQHPHIPSLTAILSTLLGCVTLLLVGLWLVLGGPPPHDLSGWLNVASTFILAAAAGILSELRWKGAQDIAFAFIAGTAGAFVLLVLKSGFTGGLLLRQSMVVALLALVVVTPSGLLRSWRWPVAAVTVVVLLCWLLLGFTHFLAA